jgi:hypothetical protein
MVVGRYLEDGLPLWLLLRRCKKGCTFAGKQDGRCKEGQQANRMVGAERVSMLQQRLGNADVGRQEC